VGKRVLVVEDDETTRFLLAELLGDAGYAVDAAADGAEALAALRRRRPDLILLDVFMPRVDAPAFRALQVGIRGAADVPVLLTSATQAADLETMARDLGAAGAIAKPFDADDLLTAIARLTGGPH
jgi:CheY-like chemotaxis protein